MYHSTDFSLYPLHSKTIENIPLGILQLSVIDSTVHTNKPD